MLGNVKKSPITTILGIILILTGVFYLIYPEVTNSEFETSNTALIVLFSFGGGLLVSPDNLITIIKEYISKKL